MDNSATLSLTALLQGINPALVSGQGGDLSANQSVISGEQFGALLQQLLGGGGGADLDAVAMQQLLPQGGEALPLSGLDTALLGNGLDAGMSQDQSMEMLLLQFKQLGLSQTGTETSLVEGQQAATLIDSTAIVIDGAVAVQEPIAGTQLSANAEEMLPRVAPMTLSVIGGGGKVGPPLAQSEVIDMELGSQSTPLPAHILSQLKFKSGEVANQSEPDPVKQESLLLPGNGLDMPILKPSMVPLALAMNMVEGKEKGGDVDLAALTGLHISSHTGDRSASVLKAATDAASTGQMKPGRSTALDTPMASPQWKSEFSQRILMMTKEGVQTADIKLNPAHLGPIEVRITLNDDQASISFSANHSLTREAIENSMPRLRELLQSNGLMLADAQVSEQSPRDSQQRRQPENRWMSNGVQVQNEEDLNLGVASRGFYPVDQGLALAVDFYA